MKRIEGEPGQWSGTQEIGKFEAPEGEPITVDPAPVGETFHSGRTPKRDTDSVNQAVKRTIIPEEAEPITIDLPDTTGPALAPGNPNRYNPQSIFDLRSRTWVALLLAAAAVSCPAKKTLKDQTAGCSTVPLHTTVELDK